MTTAVRLCVWGVCLGGEGYENGGYSDKNCAKIQLSGWGVCVSHESQYIFCNLSFSFK